MILACVILVGMDLRQCWVSREIRLEGAKTETANLARSIAAQVHEAFSIADTVLFGLRERVPPAGAGQEAMAELERKMRSRVASQDLIHGLFLLDEHGVWLANSVPGTSPGVSYADRDYFRYHRDVDSGHVFIGAPVRGKSDGAWVIPVTRRINHADGSFAGVVSATIATAVFQSVFGSFDIGKQGAINLTNGTPVLLVRQPYSAENVGRNVSSSPVLQSFVDASVAKSFEYVGLIDGLARIGSFNRVPGFDLIVIVSREKNEVLAAWWRDTTIHLTWMGFAVLALVLLGWRRIIVTRQSAQNEALYRLLADNSSDAIVCLTRDGRRRYVSPAFAAMTGWTEAELLGKSLSDIVVPEDRPVAAALFAELMAGTVQVAGIYRYLCRDGTTVWIELRARPTADPLGGLPIFVGNIRNIARQKAIEEQLAATNAELAAINLTDPLTGIANRRHFDEVLLKEWNRAMRAGSDLALLMVDADHFKTFNDHYGHPQGDACLRAIAVTLAASIRRPGDLAARYGGEEFAVILPGTSAEAAAGMAELMRQRLVAQAIEHLGNEVGMVTVSIGVAALTPRLGSDAESLIKAADEALYEAKRSGRNRVELFDRAVLLE